MPSTFNRQEFCEQLDAIKTAAQNGDVAALQCLHKDLMAQHNGFIDDSNARALLQNDPISLAAQYGHLECVRFLVPWSDLQNPWNNALIRAVENERIECLNILLPHCNEEAIGDVLVAGAYHQQWRCVNLIFDSLNETNLSETFDDLHEDLCTTLLWASQYQQYDLIQRLYPLCDIDHVLEYARGRWDDHELLALTEYHTSVQQKQLLTSVVERSQTSRRSKM